MVQQLDAPQNPAIIYPDSDDQPMAENTKQFTWIVVIKENLEILFAENPEVFVAGDLLWYPTQGNLRRQAPDIMVVFGRPKSDRGSYKQWEENNIAPQVVFEILSPGNRTKEMSKKLLFYEKYGVEEYYIYDPEGIELTGLLRSGNHLEVIEDMNSWVSPRLKIRFELSEDTLQIYRPDNQKFLTFLELEQRAVQAEKRAAEAQQRAEQAEARIQELEARLREAGIEPN